MIAIISRSHQGNEIKYFTFAMHGFPEIEFSGLCILSGVSVTRVRFWRSPFSDVREYEIKDHHFKVQDSIGTGLMVDILFLVLL
jgi:hypothetical protein